MEVERIKTFRLFLNKKARYKVMYGGAGSGKSYAAAQYVLRKFLSSDKKRFIVARKTLPSLKRTAYRLCRNMVIDWGMTIGKGGIEENKQDLTWRYKDKICDFMSIDDPEKIKSMEADVIWIEEATDLTEEDVNQLRIRLSRTDDDAELIFTFNPIDINHPLIKNFVNAQKDGVIVHHSTYKDNPFVSETFKQELESYKTQDENFYRVYTMGEPGFLKNIIYSNYIIESRDKWPDRFRPENPEVMGLDFGFNNPMSLTAHWMLDRELYTHELFYESGYTTQGLIAWMNRNNISKKAPIYCDNAEPDRIMELTNAGYNALPADKAVSAGIDFIKSLRWHISADSVGLAKEVISYKYLEKNTSAGTIVLDEPVKLRDHSCDSSRYGIYTHYKSLVTRPDSSRFLVSHMGRMKK